jgi:hypothetical protein
MLLFSEEVREEARALVLRVMAIGSADDSM